MKLKSLLKQLFVLMDRLCKISMMQKLIVTALRLLRKLFGTLCMKLIMLVLVN